MDQDDRLSLALDSVLDRNALGVEGLRLRYIIAEYATRREQNK